MCLLYFSLLKTVLNWGGEEVQKDGRCCVELSCMATPGVWWPRTTLQLVFDSIIRGTGENFLEAEGYLSIPFRLPPSQLMLSQLQLIAYSRNALLLQGEESLPGRCLAIQLQKACKGFEQFVSEWYFYLYGNVQTLKYRLYFCINSKWMISYPWIKSPGTMMVNLALYW